MKKVILKNTFIEIKKTYKRFISTLLMAMLGVGFFVGIKATSPNMKSSLDNYFDKNNVFDIKVISTLGLTDEDVESIKKINGVKEVYGVYDKDVIFEKNNIDYILNAMEYTQNVNQFNLVEGRLPENEYECIVEENFIHTQKMNIGDTIQIKDEKQDDEKSDYKNEELKIVGTAKSPLYISMDKGNSKLGSGKVNYYIYIPKSNINSDVYSSIYIIAEDAKELDIHKKQYEDLIGDLKGELEKISNERELVRYNSLVGEATEKINEAEDKLNNEREKAEKEILENEKKIQDAENKVIDGENELNANIIKVDKEFLDAENKLKISEKEYDTGKKEAEKGLKQAESEKINLENQLEQINKGIEDIRVIYDKSDYETKVILEQQIKQLEESKIQIENGIKIIKDSIAKINRELENGKMQLENAKKELEKNKTNTYKNIENARKELVTAKTEIGDGKRELEENKQEFENKIQEAQNELSYAKKEISDMKEPKWYVLDRKQSNIGYNSLMQDAESINNISKVFPLMFFIVATLMSLTAMTRMIDEQRTEIGTLKALGYSKLRISSKYIIYSAFATILGGIMGAVLGYAVIPPTILDAYSIIYELPRMHIIYDYNLIIMGLLIVTVCIVGGALYASYRKLRYVPAQLMRPKAPKPGKRVFLERISFIWKKLSFSQKVTLRNIFRYKKRFLMTIIGISGATALILVGFGIKNSVSEITSTQYEKIYHYHMLMGLKDSIKEDEKINIINNLQSKTQIEKLLYTDIKNMKIMKNEESKEIQLMIVENKDSVNEFITLRDRFSKENYELNDDSIIVTERISKILGIKKGDTVLIKNENDEEREVEVLGITEHYVSHYMYMTANLYKELYNDELKYNTILIQTMEQSQEKHAIGRELLKHSDVSSVIIFSDSTVQLDETVKTLNLVVVVLIVSAGILTFVVLYNLSNVNISERIRELATLKVLGFYNKEVNKYVSREMTILTFIGILVGLLGGYFLTIFVLHTVELEAIMYPVIIKPISYLYAITIVVLFTIIVNIISHFALKKVDMVDSLKSVE